MVVIPDDARYMSCSHCGAVVLAIHAVYVGEKPGPDLLLWPVWICEECDEEEEEYEG